MNIQQHLSSTSFAAGGVFLAYLAQLQAGEVGPMAVYDPPAPISDCDACNDPGWYGGVSLLYLKSYFGDNSEDLDGDWDLGARGTLGFERPDGLFYELNGFWYEGDVDRPPSIPYTYDNEISAWYIEGLIGDNLHCGEACLDLAFGLRYANLEVDETRKRIQADGAEGSSSKFDGFGPVVRIDGTRRLTDQVTLYAGMSQAILFGDQESKDFLSRRTSTSDTLAFVTELEGGVQFDFNVGQLQGAHAKLGIEGQYWSIGGSDFGLFGGVLGVGFNF